MADRPLQTQCNLFQTIFNPSRIRMGNKILRQRLKGAALAGYYPRRPATMADIQKEFKRYDMEVYDEDEEYRLEGLQIAKLRGKGAPKKKTTANSMCLATCYSAIVLTIRQQRKEEVERRSDEAQLFLDLFQHDTLYDNDIPISIISSTFQISRHLMVCFNHECYDLTQ